MSVKCDQNVMKMFVKCDYKILFTVGKANEQTMLNYKVSNSLKAAALMTNPIVVLVFQREL